VTSPMTKHRIRFSVDDGEYQELKLSAERKFRSISSYVKQAVWSEIRRHSPSARKINKSLIELMKSKPEDTLLPMMAKDNPGGGYIYFFQEIGTDLVKIGYSTNPSGRLKGMSTDNPHELDVLAIIPGSRVLERELHERLQPSSHRSEWFLLTEQVYQIIATAKLVGDPLFRAQKKASGQQIKDDDSHVGREANGPCRADGEGVRD